MLVKNTEKGILTDSAGTFQISVPSQEHYIIVIQHIGFKKLERNLSRNDVIKGNLVFTILADHTQLSEVQVVGRTETQQAKLQPIKAEIVNTKAVQEQPSTLVELMNRSA